MSTKGTIAHAWADYYTRLLKLQGVSPASVQYQETRRAFYAGAASFMGSSILLADLSEDNAVECMKALEKELRAFVAQIGKTT